MPPPRLSRQLRPCHSPWSARLARRASTAVDADVSANYETPYSRTAGWWEAMRRGSPTRLTPAQHVNASLRGTLVARTEDSASKPEEPTASDTSLPIRKFSSFKGVRKPGRYPWAEHRVINLPSNAEESSAREHKDKGRGSGLEEVLEGAVEIQNSHNAEHDQEHLQQQLRVLMQQVEALQEKLQSFESQPGDQPLDTSQSATDVLPASIATTSARPTHTAATIHQPQSDASGFTLESKQCIGGELRRIEETATRVHTEVTRLLMRLVVMLTGPGPHSVAHLASVARTRLEILLRLAFINNNRYILQVVTTREGGRFKHLYSRGPTMDHVCAEFRCIVRNLSQAARSLEMMQNPKVNPIARSMRTRLDDLRREAENENDWQLLKLLSNCRAWVLAGRVWQDDQHSSVDSGSMVKHDNASVAEYSQFVHPKLTSVEDGHEFRAMNLDNVDESNARTILESREQMLPDSAALLDGRGPIGQELSSVPSYLEAPDDSQTLMDELFPESNGYAPLPQVDSRDQYGKLDLPEPQCTFRLQPGTRTKTLQNKRVESFRANGEKITVLLLENCSTELTEFDFRRLIPKGQHIESWNRDGEFYKVIPGRDPLSLERLPMYFLLFQSSEAAHAYQNNAARIHKLAALHQTSSIYSAVPSPKGFLEQGEDISAATNSYLLSPPEHPLSLRMLMQPYQPALRALLENGGYMPLVTSAEHESRGASKVLMHIEGYEPSQSDLYKILLHHSYTRGISLALLGESASSIHRLRDLVNLKSHISSISSSNPQAHTDSKRAVTKIHFDDAQIEEMWGHEADADDKHDATKINQMIMNKVYNRWVVDFEDESAARRFALTWHRVELPHLPGVDKTWKDNEETRVCNTEVLW